MTDSARFYRIGVTALPVGLVALGVLSFAFYFLRTHQGAAEGRQNAEHARLFRKDIDSSDLRAHVEVLAESIGARHLGARSTELRQAATWLESTLGPNMGYKVDRQQFKVGASECFNIEVEITGKRKPSEIVVVGAHYDTAAGTPGADDNASGVAALVSLANTFTGVDTDRTLRFVGFANEEPPFFKTENMGSYVYAQRCKERGENIVAMISLESIGYYRDSPASQDYPPLLRERFPDTGNFAAVVGNAESRSLVDQVASLLGDGCELPVEKLAAPADLPGVDWSDHWSFWQFGYPAIMVTDTALYRNPHYHKPTDTPETLDFERLHELTVGLRWAIAQLAGASDARR